MTNLLQSPTAEKEMIQIMDVDEDEEIQVDFNNEKNQLEFIQSTAIDIMNIVITKGMNENDRTYQIVQKFSTLL